MENIELTLEHKKTLIKIARESVDSAVNGRAAPEYKIDDVMLNTMCGAFVTLHTNGNLRGCIGNITAETPLWETIRNMAIESALRDPRFPTVSPRELKSVNIEISVLSPLKRINNLGIGPAGLGGNITSLAVHIDYLPTHIAGLPVAVNVCCHAARHAEGIL